ncbi:Transmembrane protein [Echinococcus granulosus]|nr:Transmembrane protein [Echinococcus granulosus]
MPSRGTIMHYWTCLVILWAVNALMQSAQQDDTASRSGVYSVHISGVVYWGGTSLPDDISSNVTHPFGSSGNIVNETDGVLNLQFTPNYVNFSHQEMGTPAYADVTITNTSPNQSLHLISIQTSSFTLLFEPINVAVLEPQQATTITLLLVANKLGPIEAELYVTTSSGLAKCKVYGFSTPSRYGLRPLKANRLSLSAKHRFTFRFSNPHPFPIEVSKLNLSASNDSQNDESQVLFLSAENSWDSQQNADLQQVPNSITLAGQQRSGLCSLTLSSTAPQTLKGFVSGIISLENVSASNSAVPKNSSSNFLLRQFSFEPTVFLVPFELHFDTSSNLFNVQEEVLDFGSTIHSDPPRQLHLTAFNQMSVPSALSINAVSGKKYLDISYDPVVFPDGSNYGKEIATITFDPAVVDRFGDFSGNVEVETDGQPPIVIPYTASVLRGSLRFSHKQLSFYCGYPGQFVEKMVSLTNTFDYPLEIWGYQLPEAYADLFEIGGLAEAEYLPPTASANVSIIFRGFKQEKVFECKITSFNLTFYTNASSFHIPFTLYDAKLKILSPSAETSDDALTFDIFDVGSQYTRSLYISNPNPIAVVIQRLLVDSPAGSLCVSLAQLRQHSGLFCHHHGHHHQGSEVEVILMSGRNCNSEPLTLQPSSWMHFSIIFNQEQVDSATEWVLTVESKLVSISKLLRFRVPAKVLTMEPPVLDLGSVFPGKPLSQDILVPSSLARPEEVTSLEFHSIHGMPSFRVDLSHVAGVTWVNLEPNRTTLMGVLSYNAWLGCREILAASTTSGFENDDASARVCYAGFEVGSAKGGYWFASNFFPFLKDEGLPNHGVTSTPSSGIAFFPGLRFSASLFTQLRNAWRSLTRRIHVATVGVAPFIAEPTEECKVIGRVAIHSIDKEPSFVGRLVANLIWPRILSERVTYEKANAKSTPSSSPCHLNFQFGSTEGLAQLWIQNLVTEVVTCRLTLINPTEKPLIIQPILLDDLLPLNMNYTEMVEQMPSLTAELFSAAHVPQHLAKFPRHPSQRTGRFTSYRDTAKFDDDSLASLRSVLHYHSLQNVVLPTCCPVYVLPPKGGEVTYLITFTPGAFHNESIGYNHHPKFDNSLLLLRNNLTALETVLLQTVTRTAVVGVRSGLLPIDSSSHTTEGSERSFTTFPTATGLAFDAAVSFNPLLVNPACESTPLAGIVDVARYDLRSESGNALCPVAAASERNLSLCRVSATLLNNSIPDGALFSFTFNEGHLRSLCSDGAVHPRPSITRFLEGLKSAFPFNFFRLSNSQSSQSSMESSRFSSPLQLAWAMDEDGMPIFSSEFISGLVLSRRIALFNPGSLSVWIMRVGFKQPGSAGYTSALGQCDPHLYGFSVALCDSDVMATSTRSRHKTADGALREFELKPGEQRWLEVLYSPDFLHTEVNVELCLFASLLAPSTGRPVWLSKRMMELEPVIGDFRSSSSSSFSTFSSSVACNANSVNECSVFQLDSIKLSAKISSPLTRLCHSSLIRPPFEDNLWSLLLFVFASNLAGIFVAASFDAIRLLSFHESCRQVTAPVTTTANANSDSDQQSSSQLFSLNFNLPVFEHQHQQQDHQQQNNSLSPCLRVVGATTSQPASDDTYCRRRSCRTLASEMADRQQGDKYSTFGIARTVAKSLVRGLRAAATGAGRAVYLPLTRGLGMVGKRWSSALSPLRSQTAEVERSGRAAMRRVMKSSIETSSAVRNQQHQGQNRRGGAENAESVGTLANPRKSSDEVKRTAKQSAVRTNGEILSSSLSNNTQVCSDGTTTAVWTNQSAIGGCIKNRGGGGAKHNALGTVPGELQASLRAAATAMTGGGALKKNSLSNSTNTSVSTTTPSSPKMRTAKSSASLGTPPPPTPPPPPPSLIMESIKVESASMGVKKPRQFGHQQQQQQLSKTTAAVAALIPQSQGSCRPSGQRYNSSKEASLPKQKSPLAGAIDTVASESLAQRKKSAKPMAPTKLSSINTTATGTAASLPPWQTRKASAPIEVQCSDQWRQPSASEPVENEVGSSGLASHAGRPTTAWAGVSRSEGAAAAPRLTTNHLGDLEFPPLGSAVARRSVKTVPVAGGGKILLSPELSRLVTETSEFDRQMRCLPPNTHRFHNATNWDDITQHLRQHPQHHFSARYCIPHATSSLLSTPRGQYTTPMAHRHHRPCLYNASYPMTTMPCPPSSSSTYCHSTNTAPTATEYASHGYTYLQHQQNPFEPVVFSGTSVNDLHVNSRDHRRRRSSTGQIFTSAEKPTATTTTTTTDSAVATDDQELANLMLFSSHKSDMGLTSILPKMDGDVVAVVEEGSSADERFCPPEWLNAFDTSPPPPLQTTTGATVQGTSAPPCELEQLTATRRRWMLMHEQRGRMRSEETGLGFESNDFPLLDCEHLVPSTPMNSRPTLGSQLDDPFLHKNKSNVAFDKTVGGQLTNAIPAVGVTPSSQAKTPQALPDAFGMFQKTWLPAFLPWRSRFSTEDPTRDPDFAEATLYFSSCQPDIPGPIIQEVTEPTTASDDSSKSVEDISDEMGQLTEVRAGQMLPCHDVSDDKRT